MLNVIVVVAMLLFTLLVAIVLPFLSVNLTVPLFIVRFVGVLTVAVIVVCFCGLTVVGVIVILVGAFFTPSFWLIPLITTLESLVVAVILMFCSLPPSMSLM